VVISKDEDFLYYFGSCCTKALHAAINRLWPKIEAGMKAGDRIIEPR
jgi:hypothetical protein